MHILALKILIINGESMSDKIELHSKVVAAWNSYADEYNQWPSLGEDEKVEYAYQLGYKAALDGERIKFFALYQAAQALAVRIGATDAYMPEVQAVMNSLHDLDGGAPWSGVEAIRHLGGE